MLDSTAPYYIAFIHDGKGGISEYTISNIPEEVYEDIKVIIPETKDYQGVEASVSGSEADLVLQPITKAVTITKLILGIFIKTDANANNLSTGTYQLLRVEDDTKSAISFCTNNQKQGDKAMFVNPGDTVYGLVPGIYEIKELVPPNGYIIANNVAFKVDEEGNIYKVKSVVDTATDTDASGNDEPTLWIDNTVIMVDKMLTLGIINIDDSEESNILTAGEFEISGIFAGSSGSDVIGGITYLNANTLLNNKLIVTTGDEEGVDKFTYTLAQTKVLDGYVLQTDEILFTILTDGTIVFEKNTNLRP